jgi:ribokinase
MAEGGVPRILVIGSINMDLVLEMERVPRGGETLLGQRYSYIPGGKGANQAVAAARLGAAVTFVGRVGADPHGQALRRHLSLESIDQELLAADDTAQTGFAVIQVDSSGENRIVVYPGANLCIHPEDVRRAFERPVDALTVNLEIAADIVELACRLAGERGIPAVLDAGPVREFDLRRVRGLEVLSPNETETLAFSGRPCGTDAEAARAARELQAMTGCRYVVLKLGARGAFLYEAAAGTGERIPGYPVQAVDTTAAGDAFTAALADGLLRTHDIRRAVRWANAAGALAVTRLGAQPSMPRRAEVEGFLRERGARA